MITINWELFLGLIGTIAGLFSLSFMSYKELKFRPEINVEELKFPAYVVNGVDGPVSVDIDVIISNIGHKSTSIIL